MKLKYYVTCICFWLITTPLFAATLIIEPEMGRAPILYKIYRAKQSIQLVTYNLTDKAFIKALVSQKEGKRLVEVILEKSPYRATKNNKKAVFQLKKTGIEHVGKIPNIHFIHQKTLLLDRTEAVVMTFNFTQSAFKNQRNFALVFNEPTEVNDIINHFDADFKGLNPKETPNSNLIWSPENSRKKLTAVINSAKKELHIYAQSVEDKGIIDALQNAAKRGVKVAIITSSKPSIQGVKIFQSLHYYIHAKVIIADNQMALIGSTNLTKNSIDNNRELTVMTRDKNIIRQLQATFAYDSGLLPWV